MGDIVAGLKDIAETNDDISVRAVIDEFGSRSFAPFMLILSLIGALPTGGIPGVPTAVAVIISLVAVQLMFGRDSFWVPGFIANRSVPSDKLSGTNDKLEKVADWLDSIAKGRMEWLTGDVALRLVGAIIVLLCCFIPPLELLPFAAAVPFAAIAVLSLALIVRDGLAVLIGGAAALGAVGMGIYWLMG